MRRIQSDNRREILYYVIDNRTQIHNHTINNVQKHKDRQGKNVLHSTHTAQSHTNTNQFHNLQRLLIFTMLFSAADLCSNSQKAASQLSCQNSLEDVAVWPRPSPLVCCSIALDMNSVQLQCCSNSADKATTPTQLRSCIMMTPCIYKLHTFPVLLYSSSSAVKLENCSSNISMLPVMSRLRQRALQRLSAA